MYKPNEQSKVEQIVEEASRVDTQYDPDGSYTGNPVDEGSIPVQDADDL